MDDRHVVWSNENLDLEDWRTDLEEEYPGYSDEELYVKSCEGAKCVAGVISDTYGCLLGGDPNMTPEELDKNFKPIGLAGRVKVNVVGKIEKGDKLVATDNGCARAYNPEKDSLDDIIGYAVIADDKTEKRQLKMKIK